MTKEADVSTRVPVRPTADEMAARHARIHPAVRGLGAFGGVAYAEGCPICSGGFIDCSCGPSRWNGRRRGRSMSYQTWRQLVLICAWYEGVPIVGREHKRVPATGSSDNDRES